MDLKNPRVLKLKGALFLLLAILSSVLLVLRTPEWTTVLLLGIALWAACRFYYFAFYVLQHYADPDFRYRGLWPLFRYLLQSKKAGAPRSNIGRP